MAQDSTEIPVPTALGPDPIRLHHPEGAFVPTPASLIALEAIAAHSGRFRGRGLDWGSGSGLLDHCRRPDHRGGGGARAGTRPARGGGGAGERAPERSRGQGPVRRIGFLRSGLTRKGSRTLAGFEGSTDFMIANPPSSSPVGDGFEMRRVVVRGAIRYLRPGGLILLSVSSQYGEGRVTGLLREDAGIPARRSGSLHRPGSPSTWVERTSGATSRPTPAKKRRGGLTYAFRHPRESAEADHRGRGVEPLPRNGGEPAIPLAEPPAGVGGVRADRRPPQ